MKKATVTLSTVLMTAMMLTSCGGIAKKESTTTNKESSNEVTIGKQTSKAEIINGNIDSDTERNSSDFKLLMAISFSEDNQRILFSLFFNIDLWSCSEFFMIATDLFMLPLNK